MADYALDFERDSSQYGKATYNSVMNLTGSITIEGWVIFETIDATVHHIVSKRPVSVDYGNYSVSPYNGQFRFYFSNTVPALRVYTTSGLTLSTVAFKHFAVCFTYGTPASMAIYYDGVKASGSWTSGDGSGVPITSTDDLSVGARISHREK